MESTKTKLNISKTKGNQIHESQSFSYDANGNRLNLTENKDTTEEIQTVYSILENSNRLTKVADTDYQYDNNGNIINDGEHTYNYDARNRLVSIDNGTTASYRYNANNMRVMKTTVNGTTIYGWDNDRIFAEYNASGNPIQETVYFGSTPIALLKDGKTYRIFADQIDTPRVITDNTNTTLWAWDSKPFGETKPNEDVDGDNIKLSYNLRFSGQYYDAETRKHYNFNRDYDPVTGRYVQSDPIGLGGGMNGFVYSLNRPSYNIDPTGEYNVNLLEHEFHGGHTIKLHVAKSISFLRNRLVKEGKARVSSFYSLSNATSLINMALNTDPSKINQLLAMGRSGRARDSVNVRFKIPTGFLIGKKNVKINKVYNLFMFLEAPATTSEGFLIVTAYPF